MSVLSWRHRSFLDSFPHHQSASRRGDGWTFHTFVQASVVFPNGTKLEPYSDFFIHDFLDQNYSGHLEDIHSICSLVDKALLLELNRKRCIVHGWVQSGSCEARESQSFSVSWFNFLCTIGFVQNSRVHGLTKYSAFPSHLWLDSFHGHQTKTDGSTTMRWSSR